MKYNIFVDTQSNDQPTHTHLRHEGIRAVKVERIFRDTLQEEYERLNRGIPKDGSHYSLDWTGTISAMDFTARLESDGMVAKVRVRAEKV